METFTSIYHITGKKEWEDALTAGIYKTPSFDREGFIHCSPLEKIKEVAENFYKNQNELVLLCINANRVNSKIVWEDLYKTGFNFPHVYGELNLDAVVKVVDFRAEEAAMILKRV